MKRIHIVGTGPRTGTTLLAECFVACFEINAHARHEASLYRHRRDVSIYLTKAPAEIRIVEPRLRVDRALYVICMLRDPRDVITSKHRQRPECYWAPLRMWKQSFPYVRRLVHHPRFMTIRYEELVNDPDGIQQAIMARMPFLKKKAPFSAFHAVAKPSDASLDALGGLRPIGADRIGNWRSHLPRVAGQLELHGPITAELIEFGYERDAAWLSLLDGVKPDLTPSRWPEFRPHRRFQKGWHRPYTEAVGIVLSRLIGRQVV